MPLAEQQQAAAEFNRQSHIAAFARAGLTRISLDSQTIDVEPGARGVAPVPADWIRITGGPVDFALDRDGRLLRVHVVAVVESRRSVPSCDCVSDRRGGAYYPVIPSSGPVRAQQAYVVPREGKTLAGDVTIEYPTHVIDVTGKPCPPAP